MTESELKTIYRNKLQKINSKNGKIIAGFVNTSFEIFREWFDPVSFANGCHYCGTTNEKSFELYQLQRTGARPVQPGPEKGVGALNWIGKTHFCPTTDLTIWLGVVIGAIMPNQIFSRRLNFLIFP